LKLTDQLDQAAAGGTPHDGGGVPAGYISVAENDGRVVASHCSHCTAPYTSDQIFWNGERPHEMLCGECVELRPWRESLIAWWDKVNGTDTTTMWAQLSGGMQLELTKQYQRKVPPADPGTWVHTEIERWANIQTVRAATAGKALGKAAVVSATSRLVLGGDFALDEPDKIPTIWGDDEHVLWAEGEGLMLAGHQGVGKTTLAQQLILHRLGVRDGVLLGYPVAPSESLVLYLAMDRPRQAARSQRRMVSEDDREKLNAKLVIWRGPLPFNLLREDPSRLADWITEICPECRTIVVDSVKDLAAGIAQDEVGAALNIAWQEVIARDLQLLLLHHERKAAQDGKRHHTLDDVYGSGWLTTGLGSVFALDGEPGDPTIELKHLKQPATPVGPLRVRHDHVTGTTSVATVIELLDLVVGAGDAGITAEQAALVIIGRAADSDKQKLRRALAKLVADGLAHHVRGQRTHVGAEPDRWVATGQLRFARPTTSEETATDH
jgi:hypothetical protein